MATTYKSLFNLNVHTKAHALSLDSSQFLGVCLKKSQKTPAAKYNVLHEAQQGSNSQKAGGVNDYYEYDAKYKRSTKK